MSGNELKGINGNAGLFRDAKLPFFIKLPTRLSADSIFQSARKALALPALRAHINTTPVMCVRDREWRARHVATLRTALRRALIRVQFVVFMI